MSFRSHHYSSWGSAGKELYRLTDADLEALHAVLLAMYKDIRRVCDKHSIRVIAAGGTALGAVRHHGFIPWDDDMDLFMFRSEFETLKAVFSQELGDEYYLLAPGTEQGANCFLPRIGKKNTTLLSMIDETAPYPHGIYIDVNILEYAPENSFAFKRKALGSDVRRFISYSVYWNQYKSESLRSFMLRSKGARYYKLRMALGKLCAFRTAEEWFASFDRYVQGEPTEVLAVPSGSKKYTGERMTMDVVEPLQTFPFEDTEIFVFGNYDWYLKNLYGDYMTIPKPEERETHLCLAFRAAEE